MWEEISPAIILAVIFGSIVMFAKVISDNRIRREIIASGKMDENLKYLFAKNGHHLYSTLGSIKWGLVCVAIGLAIILGRFLPYRIADDITFGLIFLLSGLALLIYFLIARKQTVQKK
jgi:hypothetical protein